MLLEKAKISHITKKLDTNNFFFIEGCHKNKTQVVEFLSSFYCRPFQFVLIFFKFMF